MDALACYAAGAIIALDKFLSKDPFHEPDIAAFSSRMRGVTRETATSEVMALYRAHRITYSSPAVTGADLFSMLRGVADDLDRFRDNTTEQNHLLQRFCLNVFRFAR